MGVHMKSIEYQGVTVEYDERCVKSWKWQKKLASGEMSKIMKAVEELLCGKDEEVADAIGDDIDTMQDLLAAITQQIGEAKN